MLGELLQHWLNIQMMACTDSNEVAIQYAEWVWGHLHDRVERGDAKLNIEEALVTVDHNEKKKIVTEASMMAAKRK